MGGLRIELNIPFEKYHYVFFKFSGTRFSEKDYFDATTVIQLLEKIKINCNLLKKIFEIETWPFEMDALYCLNNVIGSSFNKILTEQEIKELIEFSASALMKTEKSKSKLKEKPTWGNYKSSAHSIIKSNLLNLKRICKKAIKEKKHLQAVALSIMDNFDTDAIKTIENELKIDACILKDFFNVEVFENKNNVCESHTLDNKIVSLKTIKETVEFNEKIIDKIKQMDSRIGKSFNEKSFKKNQINLDKGIWLIWSILAPFNDLCKLALELGVELNINTS